GPAGLLISWLGIGAWHGQRQTVARGRSGERRQRTRLAGEVGSRRVVDLKRRGRQDEIVAVAVMEAQLIVSGLAGSFQRKAACVARDSKGSEKAFAGERAPGRHVSSLDETNPRVMGVSALRDAHPHADELAGPVSLAFDAQRRHGGGYDVKKYPVEEVAIAVAVVQAKLIPPGVNGGAELHGAVLGDPVPRESTFRDAGA